MTIRPAPVGAADWLDAHRVQQEPEATQGIIEAVFPWRFEALVALRHDVDPSTGTRAEGQLSREQAALLGEIFGHPDEVTVGVWVGSPTRLRADGGDFVRWEARPRFECFVGVAPLTDLVEAQPSYDPDTSEGEQSLGAPEASGSDGYVHHLGGSSLDPLSAPSLWWSADHEWLVVTDPDLPFTLIGGSAATTDLLRGRAGADDPAAALASLPPG